MAKGTKLERRDFLRAAGLASVALGVGLGESRTFEKDPPSRARAPAPDFHDEIITIDGVTTQVLG